MAVTVIKLRLKNAPESGNLGIAFREVLKDICITEHGLDNKIHEYLKTQDPSQTEAEHTTRFANIKKELTRDDMSWKTFQRGLVILGYDDITLLV